MGTVHAGTLIFRVPGVTTGGSRSNQPVSLLDIYPPLAGFAPPPSYLDGTSLVAQLNDPAAEHDPVVTSYRFGLESPA